MRTAVRDEVAASNKPIAVADRPPLHVCFLCNEYPPARHGGIGSSTQTLARSLVARGNRVTVLGVYLQPTRTVEFDGAVRVVRLPHTKIRGAGALLNGRRLDVELARVHRELPIDVIEGSEMSFGILPRRLPAPAVIRMNGGHHFFAATLGVRRRPLRSWVERRSFARANHFCAVSQFVAESTRDLLELGRRPIEILPNPVDTELFRISNMHEEDGLILFVGTICEKKGVRQLIEAMPRVVPLVPGAHLLLVGRDWHDPVTGASYTREVQGLVPSELRDRFTFFGPVPRPRLPEILARASVCVYPSHMESMGLVIAEAMTMGKPVVASATGPGRELIEPGESGLLCNPHDPDSIAMAIVSLLTNPALRRRLGEAARRRAMQLFSDVSQIDKNESFYRRCAQSTRLGSGTAATLTKLFPNYSTRR